MAKKTETESTTLAAVKAAKPKAKGRTKKAATPEPAAKAEPAPAVTTTAPEPAEAKPKRSGGKRAARQAKADAAETPKEKKPPREELCVFACRVSKDERTAFHRATGPAGASRFARKLMVVFSNEDEAGFRTLLKEAREARA